MTLLGFLTGSLRRDVDGLPLRGTLLLPAASSRLLAEAIGWFESRLLCRVGAMVANGARLRRWSRLSGKLAGTGGVCVQGQWAKTVDDWGRWPPSAK